MCWKSCCSAWTNCDPENISCEPIISTYWSLADVMSKVKVFVSLIKEPYYCHLIPFKMFLFLPGNIANSPGSPCFWLVLIFVISIHSKSDNKEVNVKPTQIPKWNALYKILSFCIVLLFCCRISCGGLLLRKKMTLLFWEETIVSQQFVNVVCTIEKAAQFSV